MQTKLTQENQEILSKLVSNHHNEKISMNATKDIVNLIARMTVEAIQLKEDNKKSDN